MIDVLILAALTLTAWWLFQREVKLRRAVTVPMMMVNMTASLRVLSAGIARMGTSMRKASEAMAAFSSEWAKATEIDRG